MFITTVALPLSAGKITIESFLIALMRFPVRLHFGMEEVRSTMLTWVLNLSADTRSNLLAVASVLAMMSSTGTFLGVTVNLGPSARTCFSLVVRVLWPNFRTSLSGLRPLPNCFTYRASDFLICLILTVLATLPAASLLQSVILSLLARCHYP